MTADARPINKALWLVGADDGSTGYDVLLEWTDGSLHPLFHIAPEGIDATAVGMLFGYIEQASGLHAHITEADPRA